MTSEFGEKLIAAYEEHKTNINNFVWKGPKIKNANDVFEQEEFRLVDASDAQLDKCYKHCKTMLFNDDYKHPGRVNLLKLIHDQRNRCGVELFLRDSEKKGSHRFTIVEALRSAISNRNLSTIEADALTVGDLVTASSDFNSLPAKLVIEGGLDKLGRFDRTHITLTFILEQGLWFTKEENVTFKDLFKPGFTKLDKLKAIKEKLNLPKDCKLWFNPQGLSFSQLKSILSLRSKKYSELSLEQLNTLRNSLLFALEDKVNLHIAQWNDRIGQIETVAAARGYSLK